MQEKWAQPKAGCDLNDIIHQLSTLGKENRFLKLGFILCLVLSTLPHLAGFQPETLSAKRVVTERIDFVRRGETVMSITIHPTSDGMFVFDKDNIPCVYVGRTVIGIGNSVAIYDKDGKSIASMTVTPTGGLVSVHNNDSKLVAAISVNIDGSGTVTVGNKDGKPAALMGISKEGESFVAVTNKDGKPVAEIVALPNGNGAIATLDNNGKFTWSAPPATTPLIFPLPPLGGGAYPFTGLKRWIKGILESGKIVTLDDDSVWEIALFDRWRVRIWLRLDDIVVVNNPSNPFYPYRLINTTRGEAAEAKLLSR